MTRRSIDATATFEALKALCGHWSGTGKASYPTVGLYEYRETFSVDADPMKPLLRYLQRAEFRAANTQPWTGAHWEAGFLLVTGPGQVRLNNAQGNGRMELIELKLSLLTGGFRLSGAAKAHYNDERMMSAQRRYELRGDKLLYEMEMATNRVASSTTHLTAELHRDSS